RKQPERFGDLRFGKIQRLRPPGLPFLVEHPAVGRDRICGPQIEEDRPRQVRGPIHEMCLRRQAKRFARAKAWTSNDYNPDRYRGLRPAQRAYELRCNRDTSPWAGWRFYL